MPQLARNRFVMGDNGFVARAVKRPIPGGSRLSARNSGFRRHTWEIAADCGFGQDGGLATGVGNDDIGWVNIMSPSPAFNAGVTDRSAGGDLVDPFGRAVTYLRVSVTDRCDLRCTYCMAEDMTFLPKAEILSLEELDRLCAAFIRLGTRKIRLTGGEPLVRRDLMRLVGTLGGRIGDGLDELTLTTNGTQLAKHAEALAAAGVRRLNVSMDTLDPEKFTAITRRGKIGPVLEGIFAAKAAGIAIKINAVALKGFNEDEFDSMLAWCGEHGFDLCLIETMPMGDIDGDRTDQYLPLSLVRSRLRKNWTLADTSYATGGPARYYDVVETGARVGFITPMTHNFCESCNRVRLTCTGTLYMCLGQTDAADFRPLLRGGADDAALEVAIREAISRKPKGHDFIIDRRHDRPAVARHMSVTGG
jgi:cyclic pyranopterin phosphate synthase